MLPEPFERDADERVHHAEHRAQQAEQRAHRADRREPGR